MRIRNLPLFVFLFFGVAMLGAVPSGIQAARDVPRMSIDELKSVLESKDLVVIDARSGKDWASSDLKIKTAVREEPKEFQSWAGKYPKDKKIVIYCACPNEGTSVSLAQKLMERGYDKVYALKGGWNEWQRAKYPVEPK